MGVSVSTVWRLGQPRSGWWLAVCPGDDFALSGSDCLLPFLWDPDTQRYPSSLWLPTGSPPCEDKHPHRQTHHVYININNQEDTMAALSSVSMWWNEPCPGCWPIVPENNWLREKVRHFQTSGSLPVWSWRGSTPIPMCVCAVCSFHCMHPCMMLNYVKVSDLLYSSCSREKMCLLKYSWSFSFA